MKVALLGLALLFAPVLQAQGLPIVVWHSLSGFLGEKFQKIARDFNDIYPEYSIQLVYKGEYSDTLTSFAAAFRAGKPPAIVHVFEVGTALMLHPKGVIKPLETLMREQKISLPVDSFSPAISVLYSENNRLQAFPFTNSLPVLFYNAKALASVGVDATNFPKNWQDLESVAQKLVDKGYPCAYTTTYPGWILVEAFASLHAIPLLTKTLQANVADPRLITHIKRLKSWQKKHLFVYGGRANDATVLFTSQRCAMISQSSGSYADFVSTASFAVAVAPLPRDRDAKSNNVVGGGALWTVAGQTPQVEKGIALFYHYLARVVVQLQWFQQTGYMPVGQKGFYHAVSALAAPTPTLLIARADLNHALLNTQSTSNKVPHNQLRTILDEELEAIFANLASPEEAMNNAVQRSNIAIDRFSKNTAVVLEK